VRKLNVLYNSVKQLKPLVRTATQTSRPTVSPGAGSKKRTLGAFDTSSSEGTTEGYSRTPESISGRSTASESTSDTPSSSTSHTEGGGREKRALKCLSTAATTLWEIFDRRGWVDAESTREFVANHVMSRLNVGGCARQWQPGGFLEKLRSQFDVGVYNGERGALCVSGAGKARDAANGGRARKEREASEFLRKGRLVQTTSANDLSRATGPERLAPSNSPYSTSLTLTHFVQRGRADCRLQRG